eukprot:TRINITY_DN1365_c0_g1_i1.p1 TRINITY_DN1365_c0_g1~~TRINITY_DN1365_c0_g1_i1.p1  ORF type:complete len:393 (-),score=140.23 TRINITY_DN1365_c0_g1_i1:70-1248(-)
MQITVKILSKKEITLNVNENDTIGHIRNQTAEAVDVDPSRIKLVLKSQVLADDSVTVEQSPLTENSKIIAFLAKVAKATKPKSETKPTTTPIIEQSETKNTPQAPKKDVNVEETSSTPVAELFVESNDNQNSLITPVVEENAERYVEQRSQLEDMGFPAAMAKAAIEAANGSVELATRYCLEGIPEIPSARRNSTEVITDQPEFEAEPERYDLNSPNDDIFPAFEPRDEEPVQDQSPIVLILSQIPNVIQLQTAVRAQPEELTAITHALISQVPQLLPVIREYFDDYVNFFITNPADEIVTAVRELVQQGAPPAIEITREEMADIDNLVSITQLPKPICAQVYVACGKNMDLALNNLLDNRESYIREVEEAEREHQRYVEQQNQQNPSNQEN